MTVSCISSLSLCCVVLILKDEEWVKVIDSLSSKLINQKFVFNDNIGAVHLQYGMITSV